MVIINGIGLQELEEALKVMLEQNPREKYLRSQKGPERGWKKY